MFTKKNMNSGRTRDAYTVIEAEKDTSFVGVFARRCDSFLLFIFLFGEVPFSAPKTGEQSFLISVNPLYLGIVSKSCSHLKLSAEGVQAVIKPKA